MPSSMSRSPSLPLCPQQLPYRSCSTKQSNVWTQSSPGISLRNSEACLRSHQRQQQHQRCAISLPLPRSHLRDLRFLNPCISVELLAIVRIPPPTEKLEDVLGLRLPCKSGL